MRQIAQILIRNGLGFAVESAGIRSWLPFWRVRRSERQARDDEASTPVRVRRTLEELGPAYIKLGQILSTRPDILPPEYLLELNKLLDSSPPAPTSEIVAVIEQELGQSIGRLYASFDPVPIAAASIGQVHRASLQDGTRVVVKVQRPGVEQTIDADLHLLMTQVRFLESRSETVRAYGVADLAEEFAYALREELDYTVEGRHADRMFSLIGDEGVRIPRIYWERSSRRVLTQTDLCGIGINNLPALKAAGYDLAEIAERLAQVYLRQVFVHGVYHADPHPANLLVCDDAIGLVDFGIVGYLAPHMKEDLADLLFALVHQDADEMVYAITRMGALSASSNRDELRRGVQRLLASYYGVALERIPMAQFLMDLMELCFKQHVRMPADLALLARTVIILEGVARGLDPGLNIAAHLEPFVTQMVRERLSARRVLAEGVAVLRDVEKLARVLPRRVDTLSEQMEHGDLTVGIQVRRLEQAIRKLDAMANRLAFSVIVAGIVIASAMVVSAGKDATQFLIPFTQISLPIPQLGFIFAGLLGLWLLFSIIRSRGL